MCEKHLIGALLIGLLLLTAGGCRAPTAGPARVAYRPLPVEWYRPAQSACVNLGQAGEFDSQHLFAPCVISHGCGFRMFYCGSGPEEGRLFKIGIADSDDGLQWSKLDANPILAFGDGRTSLVTPAIVRCGAGDVRRENGRLRMYVVAVDFNGDKVHRLYETVSMDDGVTWSPLSGPLMENVYAPSVLHEDGRYRMWYVDVSSEPWVIRLAESADGTDWAPADPQPVLAVDQPWEKGNLFYPCVIRDAYGDGRYLMWYGSYWSAREDATAIGLAISDDGIHWHKYADNPIIMPDPDRPFESNYCTSHTVLPSCLAADCAGQRCRVCDGYQIWYATRNRETHKHKYFAIGTAISPPPDGKEAIVPGPAFSMSAERANDARLEPLHAIDRFGQQVRPKYAFTANDRRQWQQWHGAFRNELAEAIGLRVFNPSGRPLAERRRLRVTLGSVDPCDGYTRHAFTIQTARGLYVPAFLLVPDGLDAPRPAILCSHGHGIGMNDLVGLTEDGKERPYKEGYQRDFALQAVKAGFVALAFEQCGFGRRRDIDFNKAQNLWNHCEQPSKNALHWGTSMTGIRVWDAMRMIDFLQSRPEVDAERIGMAGISGGGLVTQFTTALDDRVKAACVSGYCNRYADCILAMHHCIDNYVPGLGLLGDDDDVACLIAPRPLLIESGTKDPIFPIAATRAAVRKLQRCYGLLDAGAMLETDLFEGEHQFSGVKTWTFFARHLDFEQGT